MRIFSVIGLSITAAFASAAPVEGTIKELFASGTGSVALKLVEGFPAELVASECPSYNGFAGAVDADPFLKSALLSAYVTKEKVRLSVSGCEGAWLKINAVYLSQ